MNLFILIACHLSVHARTVVWIDYSSEWNSFMSDTQFFAGFDRLSLLINSPSAMGLLPVVTIGHPRGNTSYDYNIKTIILKKCFLTSVPNNAQWCIHSVHLTFSWTDWCGLLVKLLILHFFEPKTKLPCVCMNGWLGSIMAVLQVTEHVFLCHETDTNYAYCVIWHMIYEVIWGYKPSGRVPDEFLVQTNSKIVPLYFLKAFPGVNWSLRTHPKSCSKGS